MSYVSYYFSTVVFVALEAITVGYSMLAILALVLFLVCKQKFVERMVNSLACTRFAAIFEAASLVWIVAMIAFAVVWADFLTIGAFDYADIGGLHTYFGWLTGRQMDLAFFSLFPNVFGMMAAIPLMKLSTLLPYGRVKLVPSRWFFSWRYEVEVASCRKSAGAVSSVA